ncbi:hypothetical protein ES703_81412 [subsurface metagenome]
MDPGSILEYYYARIISQCDPYGIVLSNCKIKYRKIGPFLDDMPGNTIVNGYMTEFESRPYSSLLVYSHRCDIGER